MADPLSRTWYDALVDDDGTGIVGTVWNKAQVDGLLDTIDAGLVPVVANPTTSDGADNALTDIRGGGYSDSSRGSYLRLSGNESAGLGGMFAVLGNHADAYFRVYRGSGSEAFNISSATGKVSLPIGQLVFPTTGNPSPDAYTLDDYREGSWSSFGGSPAISGSGGASGNTTYIEAWMTKIGGFVFATFLMSLTTKGTITGNLRITGLPFANQLGLVQYWPGSCQWFGMAAAWYSIVPHIPNGTNYIEFTGANAGSGASHATLQGSDVVSGSTLRGALFYQTNL